jgi:hypothetical protein
VHAAPPVSVRLRCGAEWPAVVGVTAAAAAANVTAWVALWMHLDQALPLAALAAVLAGAGVAVWARRATLSGELAWDGAQWRWRGAPGQVQPALDLGGWMLLRFAPREGHVNWLVASRARAEGPWAALRAALYARRPAAPFDALPTA